MAQVTSPAEFDQPRTRWLPLMILVMLCIAGTYFVVAGVADRLSGVSTDLGDDFSPRVRSTKTNPLLGSSTAPNTIVGSRDLQNVENDLKSMQVDKLFDIEIERNVADSKDF